MMAHQKRYRRRKISSRVKTGEKGKALKVKKNHKENNYLSGNNKSDPLNTGWNHPGICVMFA